MTPVEIEALKQIAQGTTPASPMQFGFYGIFVSLFVFVLVLLWRDRQTMIAKLLEAKDDMKGVIKEVSVCVANNTASQDRASEKHEIVLREVASLKDAIHQHSLQRALSPKEKEHA
jgi:hypothetical protein